jgi:F-type H+-transporting ATPase subunit a
MIWALLQPIQEHAAATEGAAEPFNAGEKILEHVSNSPLSEPLIHLPKILGIDFSVTKLVVMLWLVSILLFAIVTTLVRKYLRQSVPSGPANALEFVVEFVRDSIALPNVGKKWVNTWTPLLLTFFFFIFSCNLIGLIPIFDVLSLANYYGVHAGHDTFFGKVIHGSTTPTGNYNVTAALAVITFFAIILAGSKAHGIGKHFKNIVPHGLAWPVYILLWPIEIMGLFVKPFALTMRLAANMTGGHIAILAVTSLVFLLSEMFKSAMAGMAVGFLLSVPLNVFISGLELIVVVVQAYVFTLLSAVFIGMAIHAHH